MTLWSVATLVSGEGSISELCVALVESLALFSVCLLLWNRNVLPKPRVLGGTNNKQQSSDITSRWGCAPSDWSEWLPPKWRLTLFCSLVQLMLYHVCNVFQTNLRLSLFWKTQILGTLSEMWLCWPSLSVHADFSLLHLEFSFTCWVCSCVMLPGRITVLTASFPLTLAPLPPQ